MRLIPTAAVVTALVACASPPVSGRESEAQALVAALERQLTLPDASRLLGSYERYYAISEQRIEAVFLPSRQGSGGVRLVSQLPERKAGGCSVVNVVFDRARKRFERILCNDARLARAAPLPSLPALPAASPERGERG